MPLPFSHLVCANHILQNKLKDRQINEAEYFIGSTFPDIRYLTKFPREKSHPDLGSSDNILRKLLVEKDSFELGILSHLYTDQIFLEHRSEYLKENSNDYYYYPILFLLDQKLFDGFNQAEVIKQYFNSVLDKEINKYSTEKEIIEHWHNLIKKCLLQKLDEKVFCEFSRQVGFDDSFSDNVMVGVDKIKDNLEIIEKIKNFINILSGS